MWNINKKILINLNFLIALIFVIKYKISINYYVQEDSNNGSNENEKNYFCQIPLIDYSENITFYMNYDYTYQLLNFKACEHKDYVPTNSLKKIWHVDVTKNKILLDMNYLEAHLNISRNKLKCFIQNFDKKLRIAETEKNLKSTGHIKEFRIERNYKLYNNISGFFHFFCYRQDSSLTIAYENVFSVLPANMSKLNERRLSHKISSKNLKKSMNISKTDHFYYDIDYLEQCKSNRTQTNSLNKLNVFIIGIDSVSFNHFKRIFPLTYEYLKNDLEDNLIFENFNSVGENTYPNILALLTGVSNYRKIGVNQTELDLYKKVDSNHQDVLPFIWNTYEDIGYVTMFQQDCPKIGLFNFGKKGFRDVPTGFYGRPFWLKYYEIKKNMYRCFHRVPTYRTWFDLLEDFLKNMNSFSNKQTPYFTFNFLTEYTHDNTAIPPKLDAYFREKLLEFEKLGYFDKTMFILLSDHGNRLKYYSYASEVGKKERYLPFLSIKLPKLFKNTQYFKTAAGNQKKFVSFFDIYQTLRHFFYMNKYGMENLENLTRNNQLCETQFRNNSKHIRNLRGISLFENIPVNRSCSDANIPEKFCNCNKEIKMSESEFLKETNFSFYSAGLIALNFVNNLTSTIRKSCIEYNLTTIAHIKKILLTKKTLYTGVFIFSPGEAWIEADFRMIDNKLTLEDMPIRLSAYGEQSHCLKHSLLSNFCYCRNKKNKIY